MRFAPCWSLLKGNPYMIWYIPQLDLISLPCTFGPSLSQSTATESVESWKEKRNPFLFFVFYFYCSTSTFKGSPCICYFFNLIHLAILSVRSFPCWILSSTELSYIQIAPPPPQCFNFVLRVLQNYIKPVYFWSQEFSENGLYTLLSCGWGGGAQSAFRIL